MDNLNLSNDNEIKIFGFQRAAASNAATAVLRTSIDVIYQTQLQEDGLDKTGQERRKQQLNIENQELQGKINSLRLEIDNVNTNLIPHETNKIQEFNERIVAIKNQEISIPTDKVGFIISLSITILLLGYLFVFYSSTIYSAFFFNAGSQLAKGGAIQLDAIFSVIFQPKAIQMAYRAGGLTIAFVLIAPVIFLGLGYLIHKYLEAKQYFALVVILLFTLLFDALMAYQITEKAHQVQYITGLVTFPWTFSMVFKEVAFYLVIAAGFVVYVIWGLLLNATLKEIPKFNQKQQAEKIKEQRIADVQIQIDHIRNDVIPPLRQQIVDKQQEIASSETQIAKNTQYLNAIENGIILLDIAKLKQRLQTFLQGWHQFIGAMPTSNAERDTLFNTSNQEVEDFIRQRINN